MFQVKTDKKITPLDNIICFKSDDECINFVLEPKLTVYQTDDGDLAAGINYTNDYLNALNAGKKFMILDENSVVYKRGCVWNRYATMPIDNLEPYYPDLYEEMKAAQDAANC